jgi:hypothetical protein
MTYEPRPVTIAVGSGSYQLLFMVATLTLRVETRNMFRHLGHSSMTLFISVLTRLAPLEREGGGRKVSDMQARRTPTHHGTTTTSRV